MSSIYQFKIIECIKNNTIRDIASIEEELYNYVLGEL